MNFSFLSRYWSFYLIGAKNTILLALIAVLLGTAIGLGIAMCRISKNKLVRFAGTAYVEFIRGTPLLVQLFIIYYGLQAVGIRFPDVPFISKILGINFSDFMSGVITMGLNSAAYVCEIFRGGIQSIDKGQMEAARSLGLSYFVSMKRIVLPQAIRTMIPSIINQFIITLKDTSILSVIGFPELVNTAKNVQAATFKSFQTWTIVGIMYLIVITILSRCAKIVERRLNRGR